MFDDNSTPKQSSADGVAQPGSSQPASFDSASNNSPAAGQPKEEHKENNEPQDIFDSTDPVKSASTASTPAKAASQNSPFKRVSENNQTNATLASSTDREPVIKAAPSVFNKTRPSSTGNKEPKPIKPSMDLPTLPNSAPLRKHNLVIFIILILLVFVIAAAAYWFFAVRPKPSAESSPASPAATSEMENNLAAKPAPIKQNGALEPAADKSKGSSTQTNNSSAQDSDGDGLSDEEEAALGTSSQSADTDNDGLFDKDEVKVYKTDPLKPDTDGDGWLDGEEVKRKTNPLDATSFPSGVRIYKNQLYKFSFTPLDGMVLGSAVDKIVRFNDDKRQVKFYVYINGSWPADLNPDKLYNISQDSSGHLIIKSSQALPDKTPYSTDLATTVLSASNGNRYLIRYVATQRSDDHLERFEQLLKSFVFIH